MKNDIKRNDIDIFKSVATGIFSIISLNLILHYFLSYRFWLHTFEKYGLSTSSILSYEDILFTAAPLSLIILPFLFIAVLCIFSMATRCYKVSDTNKEYIMFLLILLYAFSASVCYTVLTTKKVFSPEHNFNTIIYLNEGGKIRTGKNLHLIFYGSKYIILSNNTNQAFLIPISSVKEIYTYESYHRLSSDE